MGRHTLLNTPLSARQLAALAAFAVGALFAMAVGIFAAGCSHPESSEPGELVKLRVGASPSPHAEILDFLTYQLRGEGIELEIVVFDDFVMPNVALQDAQIDANFFQHLPYLEDYNSEHGTDLTPLVGVHFEPLGIYPGTSAALDDVPEEGRVAIPSDPTNGARALNLLEAAGLISLREGVDLYATPRDIVDNDRHLQIVEVEAAQLPAIRADVDLAVINGNYALESGIEFDTALAAEQRDSSAAVKYTNFLVVRPDRSADSHILTLARLLNSSELRDFINDHYRGRVVPTF
ncbi:MAG: MetQ/NlpA family ABC transporter substrate-binding protein [Coriobacteriia bacterium]|nr:MetQ/NlpA family ABC transporter substrate-binding protein [Coriobacteriia bacterium]MCL2536715.1 MetQ/NlpA family ABC transporter substrate-binding protein [Coriobacteriia bacterium]